MAARRWLADHLVLLVGILVLVYTFVPIGYIVALSFNQPSGSQIDVQLCHVKASNSAVADRPVGWLNDSAMM